MTMTISDYMTLNPELAFLSITIDKANNQNLIEFANDCLRLRDTHKEREALGITRITSQALDLFDMTSDELQHLSDACLRLVAARSSLAE